MRKVGGLLELRHWREPRATCTMAALKAVAQLPELLNNPPPVGALPCAGSEIVV